jgi:hypothetical protein
LTGWLSISQTQYYIVVLVLFCCPLSIQCSRNLHTATFKILKIDEPYFGKIFFIPLQLTLHPYIFNNISILSFVYIIFLPFLFNLLFFTIFFRFFYKPEHFTKGFGIKKIYFGHKYKYILATNTKYIFLQSINQCDILVMNFTL